MILLADIVFSTEGIAVIGAIGALLIAAISVVFGLLIKAKDNQVVDKDKQLSDKARELADLKTAQQSYEEMAEEAITNLEKIANQKLVKAKKPKFKIVASVIPEHNSPITEEQQKTANLQTMRARLVAATLVLDLPAREGAPLETEKQRSARLADIQIIESHRILNNPREALKDLIKDAMAEKAEENLGLIKDTIKEAMTSKKGVDNIMDSKTLLTQLKIRFKDNFNNPNEIDRILAETKKLDNTTPDITDLLEMIEKVKTDPKAILKIVN